MARCPSLSPQEMVANNAPSHLIVFDFSVSPDESSPVNGAALCERLGDSFKDGEFQSWWHRVLKVLYTAGVHSGSVGDFAIDTLIGEFGFTNVVSKVALLPDQLAAFRSILGPETPAENG